MKQFDLFDDYNKHDPETILSIQQIEALQHISKRLPKIVKFLIADKFDDKFIITKDNIWDFFYSGQREKLNFSKYTENEVTLIKFFLIAFIQKNTPSFLSRKIYAFNFLSNYLKKNKLDFNYYNLKGILTEIAPLENHANTYSYIKFLLKLLILEGFPSFDIDDDFELEFIPRPKSFDSKLFYQEYEDPIDYPTISMIQKGFSKLNQNLNSEPYRVYRRVNILRDYADDKIKIYP